jgi:ureidoglycolate hydrolase
MILIRKLKKIKAKKITKQNFKKFGRIIRWEGKENKKEKNQFRIVVRDKNVVGWRIAYLIVRTKKVNFIEQHPGSFESFEPLKGRSVLFVSKTEKCRDIKAFYLENPVVLNKGVWHNVISLSSETHIKITENNDVKLIKHHLDHDLCV